MNDVNIASASVSAPLLPLLNSIATGVVVAVLEEKTPGSSPHAVLVKFGDHNSVGMLREKDMDGKSQ